MSDVDRVIQVAAFFGLVVLLFTALLPLALGTIEQLLGLTGSRRR